MSIFTLLLVSLLANVSTSILIVPCPFNIDDCSCVDPISNVEYAAATCTSENGQIPSFNGSGYSIDGALNVTFNAYWLSPGSFKAFDNIQRLGLIQPLGPAILRQTWQPGAFLGPNISGVQVSNLAGVVPPPDPLVEIASDLKELHFINCQESITLDGDAYSNFTSLRVLAFQDTHILRIDDNAFRGLEKTLGELYLQNASLIAYPTEALRDLKLLYRLDLSDSAIQDYQTFSFQRQIELAFLVLDGNNLRRAIDSGALSNLPPNLASLSLQRSDPPLVDMPTEVIQQAPKSLSVLSLAYNGFTDLMAGAFPSGSNLAALHLNGNPIVSIQAGALRPLSSLASLDLSQTQLTAFDLSLLDGMDSLVWVNLDDTYSLKTLLISHLSQVPPSLQALDVRNSGLETIDARFDQIMSTQLTRGLDISNTSLFCDPGMVWMAKHVQCPPVRMVIKDTKCKNLGVPLITYLTELAPDACEETTVESTTRSTTTTEAIWTTTHTSTTPGHCENIITVNCNCNCK